MRICAGLVTGAVAAVLAVGPAPAQEGVGDADRGQRLFAAVCAACHGLDARGDGPMRVVLAIAPPDLTALSTEAAGEFPAADVVRQIDGRDMILSHGGPMPVYGRILGGDSGVVEDAGGNPVFTSTSVLDIVAWLETVQR